MSFAKRVFEKQQEQEAGRLRDALENVRHVARVIGDVENANDLTMADLCHLSHLLQSIEQNLVEAVEAEEAAS